LNSVSDFQGTSATMQNDLIKSGSTIVKVELKEKEAEAAKFVTMLLDKTSDIQLKSHIIHFCATSATAIFAKGCYDSLMLALTKHLTVYLSTYKN